MLIVSRLAPGHRRVAEHLKVICYERFNILNMALFQSFGMSKLRLANGLALGTYPVLWSSRFG
uniref:Uncharacterized protein n=2 Tax=Anguilla anguilla TaxID=7936 RepID=A0A0E9QCB9_ANGAN